MKTIFIPIYYRPQARNVLRTDIFKTLTGQDGMRVVVFVSEFKKRDYEKEFSGSGAIFEPITEPAEFISPLDKFFGRISLFYINSPTARFLRRQWLWLERKKPVRYLVSMMLLLVIGNLRLARQLFRFFDQRFVTDDRFGRYFDKYQPALVFLPHLPAVLERAFLRSARRRRIKTVGMIHAWDNITLSKYPFRLLPDRLIVYNEIIKREAVRYLDMPSEDIYVAGWPHFDFYVHTERISRSEFCQKLGIDPLKRIILFASIGSALNPTEIQVLEILEEAISKKQLPDDLVIIFRQHPTEKTQPDVQKFMPHTIFDDSKTTILTDERSYSEILTQDMNHLADSIYHAAVTINTASTMSIDAAVFDKPIINIGFDGYEEKPLHQSVRRFYTPSHAHYQPIVKSGGIRIADSFDQLLELISMYLIEPKTDSAGRSRIVAEQCGQPDGRSGQRIGNYLLNMLDLQNNLNAVN